MMKTVYLDYNASTPTDPRVLERMLPYFSEKFGNAASKSHCYGWEAERAVSDARLQVLELIGAKSPDEIIFTSGATESNNLAIKGVIEAAGGLHLITSPIEHPCVLRTCQWLKQHGVEHTTVPIDKSGIISPAAIEDAIRPETALISVMAVNHEVGTIQPIEEIAGIAKRHKIVFHCDAAQAAGKIPLSVHRQGIDLLSISGHKLYGPKGIGALYIRKSPQKTSIAPRMIGGGQEQGYRSGTLNVPGIVGLGWACQFAREELSRNMERIVSLRQQFLDLLTQSKIGYLIHGSMEQRVPGNLNLAFGEIPSETMINALKGVAVSGGAACSSGTTKGSEVLKEMGYSAEESSRAVRVSISHLTTEAEIETACREIIRRARDLGGPSRQSTHPRKASAA